MDAMTDLSTLLHCCVCLCPYHRVVRVPRTLSCGHVMCQGCLHALAHHNAQNNKPLTCPECRQSLNDDKSKSVYPMNYTVLSLLETACQDCCSRLRTVHCSHCYKWLCHGCMQLHQPDISKCAKNEVAALQRRAETQLHNIGTVREKVKQTADDTTTAVNTKIDSCISQLEQLRGRLINQIQENSKKNADNLQKWETDTLSVVDKMEKLVDTAGGSMDNDVGELSDIVQECRRLTSASDRAEQTAPWVTQYDLETNPQFETLLPNGLSLKIVTTKTQPDTTVSFSPCPTVTAARPYTARLVQLCSWTDHQGYGFSLQSVRGKKGHFIGRVDPDSPADVTGLREGDRLVGLSGEPLNNKSHADVVKDFSVTDRPLLLVVDPAADVFFREHGVKVESKMSDVVSIVCPNERP